MPLQAGQILNNRYRIVKLLAQGGFGAVYRAWDLNMDSPCAVKENLDTSQEAIRQFKREAFILYKLHHRNLPRVTDHFSITGQGQYLVMDFVEGEDLQEKLEATAGPLSETQIMPWMEQICDALHYLHRQNPPIFHRDIKPANIKITPDGKAMLVDFGIAKVFDPQLKTAIGARAVTPGYSPHEQYGHGKTNARTDIYALGATLYTLLTGKVPEESVHRVVKDILIPPQKINPAISPGTAKAIEQAMQMDPHQRPQSTNTLFQLIKSPTPVVSSQPRSQTSTTQPVLPGASREHQPVLSKPKTLPKWLPWIAGLTLIIVLGMIFWPDSKDTQAVLPTETAAEVAVAVTNTSQPQEVAAEAILPSITPTLIETPTLPPHSPTPILPSPTDDPLGPPECAQKGQTWTSPKDGMVLSCIPAGEFLMGSVDGETDEQPVHTIYLDAYWMDQSEVTSAQFNQFTIIASYVASPCADGDDHPVACVTWKDAWEYCDWAGRRLPTEAEWEKAARGNLEGMKYPWGNNIPSCAPGSQTGAQFQPCDGDSIEVKIFSPNGYGLFDMAGNISEWVFEFFMEDYYNSYPSNGWPSNPVGPKAGTLKVRRGGGWNDNALTLSVANRSIGNPVGSTKFVGFRCVTDPGL